MNLSTPLSKIWVDNNGFHSSTLKLNSERLVLPDLLSARLFELGARIVEPRKCIEARQRYILPLGAIDKFHYWIEWLDVCSLGVDWKFRARSCELEREDRGSNIWAQLANRHPHAPKWIELGHGRMQLGQVNSDWETVLNAVIAECQARYCEDLHIHNLGVKAQSRIDAELTTRGYWMIWPEDVVFDLERVSIVGSDKKYYVDSIDRITTSDWGAIFKDLNGVSIFISAGTQFVVEALTFRNVEELATESSSLVVSCVELLQGFSFARAIPIERIVPIYGVDGGCEDPLVLENWIAYNFYVPIPAIAETMVPIIAGGGVNI